MKELFKCSVSEKKKLLLLFWLTFVLIGYSISWRMVVGANWLIWSWECFRAVSWSLSCSSCTPWSFSPCWRKKLCWWRWLTFGCCFVVPWEIVAVTESRNRDLNKAVSRMTFVKPNWMLIRLWLWHLQVTHKMHPHTLTHDGTVLKESDDRLTFNAKTILRSLSAVSRAATHRLGITIQCFKVFQDRSLLLRSFERLFSQKLHWN